jgi:PKD domain
MKHSSLGIALLLAATACSSSNSGSGKDNQPPSLSNLVVNNQQATVPVGQTTTFTGSMQVADGDGDAQTLQVSAAAQNGGQPASTSSQLPAGASGNTAFVLNWSFAATPPAAGTYVVSLTVIDSEGQTSNALTFTQAAQ